MIGVLPRPWRLRHRFALLSLPLGLCLTGIAMLVVELSFRLTNPPGYSHPGPAVGLRPNGPSAATDPLVDLGIPFQDVSFPTAGQSTLRGWLVPGTSDARVGVVTAHGRGADRRDFLRHLPIFHELGLPTLLFDYREHGNSDGAERGMSMGYGEAEDISSAVRYLKEQIGVERVAVVGISLGASAAILAAAEDEAINAVVAESPFSSMESYLYDEINRTAAHRPLLRPFARQLWWPSAVVGFTALRQGISGRQSPQDVVHRISPRPLLLMHGTGDVSVAAAHSEELYLRAGSPKDLWIAEGAGHTQIYDRYPDAYRVRITAFLDAIEP